MFNGLFDPKFIWRATFKGFKFPISLGFLANVIFFQQKKVQSQSDLHARSLQYYDFM